ncbi:limbic system-associated membrane protein-like isoform X1 [Haliotis rubra]|uniref:limbic system-associated membrane protein-like isoform X1 n=1 Tax=Haliotis rubra TaxID=36100 RepID=UPI001EE5EB93|nr:limbic system-associated membrane protein-like isoform X1 [Haliotis rubra]
MGLLLYMQSCVIVTLCLVPATSLGVELEPSFDVPMVNVTVKEGTTAILPCSVKFLGQHQVVWTDQLSTLLTFEDRRIIDDERLSIERPYTKDWNLHIRSVRYRDQGIYSCQINTSPVKIKTINLNVIVPAKILPELSSEDMAVREGETVTLICNVTGIPMPTVTWYRHNPTKDDVSKDSEFCPGTNKIGISGEVLLIHNVSRYCGGNYECIAFNGVPPAVNRLIRISVEFPPEVSLPNKRIGQDVGRETILECKISAYPQAISVWMRKGVVISNGGKYRVEIYHEAEHTMTLSLRIRNLEDTDFGSYTCMSSNSVGKDAENMILYDYSANRKTTAATTSIIPTTTSQSSFTTTTIPIITWNPHASRTPDGKPGDTVVNIVTRKPTPRPDQRPQLDPGNSLKAYNTINNNMATLCTGSLLPVCAPGGPVQSKTVQGQAHKNICSTSVVLCGLIFVWFHS